MGLTLFEAPGVEPVTLAEAKDHLRVTHGDQDALIDSHIVAARQWVEDYTGRALITQTWDWTLDRLPLAFDVPLPPLQSITSIKYIDTQGVEQTLAASLYTVDVKSQPARIVPAYLAIWPVTRGHINDVTVRMVVGYDGAGAVPTPLRQALLVYAQSLYEQNDKLVATAVNLASPYKFAKL